MYWLVTGNKPVDTARLRDPQPAAAIGNKSLYAGSFCVHRADVGARRPAAAAEWRYPGFWNACYDASD